MSKYFIDRPVFAWVIAIVIMLAGGLSILGLPIEQYPSIAPPSVRINATYPGASAQTVEGTVTQVIEQQMNGLDHLRYISSNSDLGRTTSPTSPSRAPSPTTPAYLFPPFCQRRLPDAPQLSASGGSPVLADRRYR